MTLFHIPLPNSFIEKHNHLQSRQVLIDSSANHSYTDIKKQELCWSFAGSAAFLCANEDLTFSAERHLKSHGGDGCLQGLKVQGLGPTWDVFAYFESSKLDTNLRIRI